MVMKTLQAMALVCALLVVAAAVYVWSGAYDIGADVPHGRAISGLLGTLRARAIATHAEDIQAPPLDAAPLIEEGAGHYAAMCSTCHLAPGYDSDETWQGLYPQPPKLAAGTALSPAEIFWVLKHGIKMSGMPAWGKTHSDQELWALTAFVVKLPTLSAQAYKDIVAKAPPDDMLAMPMPDGAAMPGGAAMPASGVAPRHPVH